MTLAQVLGLSRLRRYPLVAFLVFTAGCTEHNEVQAPGPYINQSRPKTIWVERHDTVTRVDQPQMTYFGDTIVGLSAGRPVRIPLASVTRATVSQLDWQTTGLSLVALVALAIAVDLPAQFSKSKGGL